MSRAVPKIYTDLRKVFCGKKTFEEKAKKQLTRRPVSDIIFPVSSARRLRQNKIMGICIVVVR